MKKVLIISNTSWYLYNFRKDLISKVSNLDSCSVEIVAPRDNYTDLISSKDVKFLNLEMDRKGRSLLKEFLLFLKMLLLVLRKRPKLIISYTIKPNIYMGLIASLFGIKYINNVTGLGTAFIRKDLFTRFIVFLYKLSFRRCEVIFFQNEYDFRLFREAGIQGKNHVIINGSGVDTSIFSSKKDILNSKYNFIMIARLLKDKGIIEFFEASRLLKNKIPEVRIGLVGDIDEGNSTSISRAELEKYIKESGVEYLGHQDNMQEVYELSRSVVLPSYREGFSRVLLEGAAMGRVLLASDVPGCNEIARDGINGFCFESRNAIALYEAMLRFLELPPEKVLEMSRRSREIIVENYSTEIVNKKYIEAIERVLSS